MLHTCPQQLYVDIDIKVESVFVAPWSSVLVVVRMSRMSVWSGTKADEPELSQLVLRSAGWAGIEADSTKMR